MHSSIDITNYLPLLATLFGGGVAVTLIAQAVKKVFGLNSAHVIHLMVMAVSVAAAVAQYLLQNKNLPVEVLGLSSGFVYAVSQAVYKEAGYISDFLSRVQIADAPSASTPQSDAAVNAVTVPDAAVAAAPAAPETTTPSAPNNNGFNA